MQDNNPHNDFANLISKYLSGNANDAEVRQLEDWVLASSENKRQFQAAKKAWMLSRPTETISDAKVEAVWADTAQQLFNEPKVVEMQPRNNRRIFMQIAAALALLASVGLWMFLSPKAEQPMVAIAKEMAKPLDLPDGSEIVLNQGSTIDYSPNIDNNRRTVKLQGDAYFDVKKDKSRPFVITTGAVEIEVLGTSFYVDSRDGQAEIQVTVQEGSVAVRSNGKEEILTAGEKAIFQKSNQQLSKKTNTDKNFNFLKTKNLTFESTPLSQVVFDLNRFYNSKISVEPSDLENCQLTANFKNKSIDAVVRIIEKSLKIESKKSDTGIVFSGVCE